MVPTEGVQATVQAYVALGANLGDKAAAIHTAVHAMASLPQTRLVRCSSLYHSESMGAEGPAYLNAAAELSTSLDPFELLEQLQRLEREAGRKRPYPNAPRTLDLDLLLYGDQRIDTPRLTVPHLRMWERAFVLVPMSEIGAECVSAAALQRVADQRVTRESAA